MTDTTLPLGQVVKKVRPNTPKQPEAAPTMSGLDELQVSRSSINATEADTTDISKHLDQVYTPKTDTEVQQGDEDRMPTILFDDELAKQLLSDKQGVPSPNPDNQTPPEDPGSIKISKD